MGARCSPASAELSLIVVRERAGASYSRNRFRRRAAKVSAESGFRGADSGGTIRDPKRTRFAITVMRARRANVRTVRHPAGRPSGGGPKSVRALPRFGGVRGDPCDRLRPGQRRRASHTALPMRSTVPLIATRPRGAAVVGAAALWPPAAAPSRGSANGRPGTPHGCASSTLVAANPPPLTPAPHPAAVLAIPCSRSNHSTADRQRRARPALACRRHVRSRSTARRAALAAFEHRAPWRSARFLLPRRPHFKPRRSTLSFPPAARFEVQFFKPPNADGAAIVAIPLIIRPVLLPTTRNAQPRRHGVSSRGADRPWAPRLARRLTQTCPSRSATRWPTSSDLAPLLILLFLKRRCDGGFTSSDAKSRSRLSRLDGADRRHRMSRSKCSASQTRRR